MPYELSDFVKPGGSNAPGMSEQILMCLKSDILVFPQAMTPVAPGDTLRITTDITFEIGDGFVEAYATKDTVQLMLKKVGQKDSRGFNAELQFFVPGLNAAWAELLLNDPDVVVLVKRPDCDGLEYVCLGTKCRGMEVNGDFDSALASDESGRHGWSGMIQGYIPKYYYYTGEVTMQA